MNAVSDAATELASSGLRANRDFRLLLSGQAISALGDAISVTAMPLLVLLLTGSGALMAVVAALQFLPDLLLGLVAGALADRWDRRRLMAWSDAARALLTATIPVAFWLGGPTLAVILVVTIPINTLRVLSDAALTSSIPALVGRPNLARANSLIESVLSVPFIIGPVLAGLLIVAIGAAGTIALDAITFALSAFAVLLMRRSLRADRPEAMPSVVADIRAGLGFIVRHGAIRALIAYRSVLQVATTALVPVLGYYVLIERGMGAEVFGLLGSAWSLGYLGGSLLAGRLSGRLAGLWLLGFGGLSGVGTVAIAVGSDLLVYVVAAGFIGAGLGVAVVFSATLRAAFTPDDMLGRVGGAARTLVLGVQPLALVGFGALVDLGGAGLAMLGMGMLAIGGSLGFALLGSIRTARLDDAEPAEPAASG